MTEIFHYDKLYLSCMSDGGEEDYHLPLSSHPTFDFAPQDIAA